MILALLIFFIAAVFLMWQATVPLVLGIVLSAGSAGILLYIFIKNAHLSLTLQKSMKKYKAKWVGAVAIVSGLSTTLRRDSILLLNRRDELIIDGPYRSIVMPLESIERIGVLYGESIMRKSDRDLSTRLALGMMPNFSYIRAYLMRNPQAKNQRFIMIKPFATSEEIERSDMIVLVESPTLSNLKTLLKRPEIASIACVVEKRHNKRDEKAGKQKDNIDLLEKKSAKQQHLQIKENIPRHDTGVHELWASGDIELRGVDNNDSKSG